MIIDVLGLEEEQWADFFYSSTPLYNPIEDFLEQMKQQILDQFCIPVFSFVSASDCTVDYTVTYG